MNSVKSQVETLKGDVQTLKQSAVEAAQSAVTAKTTAVNAATTATQKAQAAGNAASNAAQHEATAFDAAERAQITYQYISNNTQWIEIEINVDEQLILRQINSTFTLDINSDGQLVLTV